LTVELSHNASQFIDDLDQRGREDAAGSRCYWSLSSLPGLACGSTTRSVAVPLSLIGGAFIMLVPVSRTY
jgi:hypothetical protein